MNDVPFSIGISHFNIHCCYLVAKSCQTSLSPQRLQPTRLLCSWDFSLEWVAISFFRGSFQLRDLTHSSGFPGGSNPKDSACNAVDPGSISGLGRSPGEGNGYPSIFLVEEFNGERSLVGYSSRGHKELDRVEWPTLKTFHSITGR